jgi:hypothetical protein
MRLRILTARQLSRLRYMLLMPLPCTWNAWVRDVTARLEKERP